jgi:hypothetical protein
MNSLLILTSVFLLAMPIRGSLASPAKEIKKEGETSAFCLNPAYLPVHVKLSPLADLVARGEGDYNSVNRGYAGDTPGGIQTLTGLSFEDYTVGQVISYQKSWLHAVGRYQLIPSTFLFAVKYSSVSVFDKLTPEIQDKLMASLILYKRPAIGQYLKGEHNSLNWAMDEMAREWASVEYRNGRGYYDNIAGNRASITRAELRGTLQAIRKNWHSVI